MSDLWARRPDGAVRRSTHRAGQIPNPVRGKPLYRSGVYSARCWNRFRDAFRAEFGWIECQRNWANQWNTGRWIGRYDVKVRCMRGACRVNGLRHAGCYLLDSNQGTESVEDGGRFQRYGDPACPIHWLQLQRPALRWGADHRRPEIQSAECKR